MRAVWVDLGQSPDYAKLARLGATHACFDIRWESLNVAYLRGVRDQGFTPGVYVAPWEGFWDKQDGAIFAEQVSARLEVIAPRTGNTMPCVMADIELHDAGYVRDFLRRWRQLRPTRVTDWTLESFQFGWEDAAGFHKGWAAELVQDIVAANVRVLPQFYKGDMTPFDPCRATLNAIKGGVPADRLLGCYDGKLLHEGWDGLAFTQGRIP